MLYRQMQYFISVVACNSFTEAAEQNYISQSAISQQIQALEQGLGVQLIVRENRKFHLTQAGEYFYNQSRELLRDVDTVRRETIRLGKEDGKHLKIGYLNYYNGAELHEAIATFATTYPEVLIDSANGTHEELRELLDQGAVDLILMEQRRAFSSFFNNYELIKCPCYVELSVRNPLSNQERLTIEDLRRTPCILIAPKEQQDAEREFYENTLGFGSSFIFAESLEKGRLMVVGNRGFMPIELVGTVPPGSGAVKRLPLYRRDALIIRNYCAFWPKERTNHYIEAFAKILHHLLSQSINEDCTQ